MGLLKPRLKHQPICFVRWDFIYYNFFSELQSLMLFCLWCALGEYYSEMFHYTRIHSMYSPFFVNGMYQKKTVFPCPCKLTVGLAG